MGSLTGGMKLPGRFGDPGDLTINGQFPEANAADFEETHVTVATAAERATVVDARGKANFRASSLGLKEGIEGCALLVLEG